MLLRYLNRAYWYIGIVLYVIFSAGSIRSTAYSYLYLVSFVAFILFGIIITETCKRKLPFFTKQNLVFTVFACSLFEVVLYPMLSYYIDRDTFVFSKADAIHYFNESLKMSQMSIGDSFSYMYQTFGFDDWGAYLWITTMFRIVPSNLFLNFSYCILGSISAVMLFDIGRCLMPRRYAYIAALTFSIASFTTLFQALCLKETVFVCLVIASFHSFYLFLRCKNVGYLLLTLLYSVSILFFRVPVALVLFFSFTLTLVLIYSKGLIVTILGVMLSLMIYSSSFFTITYERYLRGGNVSAIIERKDNLSEGGGIVNQMADPLAALIGPFPSVAVTAIKGTPLYASGLLYRLLLAAPFFAGVYYAFRHRCKRMYPLIFFFLANAIGVAVAVKGLEIRLSYPHLAMMYLVAFWWLAKYDYQRIKQRLTYSVIYEVFVAVIIICVIWNLRTL